MTDWVSVRMFACEAVPSPFLTQRYTTPATFADPLHGLGKVSVHHGPSVVTIAALVFHRTTSSLLGMVQKRRFVGYW